MEPTRRPPVRRAALVGVALRGLLAASGLAGCRPAPSDLSVTTVASGLGRPWDLAFTDHGTMFFTERGGKIRVRLTTTGEVRTLADPDDVVVSSEGGMLGIAVDPAFSQNRRIYTCFVSDAGDGVDVRVVRWRVHNAVDGLGSRTDIVTGLPVNHNGQLGRHAGCRPRFGPDGRLWVGTGDAATATVPQYPTSLGGKVLRVDTDGKGVPGNAPPPFDPRIYTPQGRATFAEIQRRYRTDAEFRRSVDRYVSEFERLLGDVVKNDSDAKRTDAYLTSETGKVYTMLAHASGRFDGA